MRKIPKNYGKKDIPVNLEKSRKESEKLLKKAEFLGLDDYYDKKEEQQP